MAYVKNRNGDNLYYRPDWDRDNRYYSCKDGSYAGRREHNNTYTDRNSNVVGYRASNGVFYDRNGNPRYKKY